MTMPATRRHRAAAMIAALVIAAGVFGRWTLPPEPADAAGEWPSADELDALAAYLSPVVEAPPRAGERGVAVTGMDDPFAPPTPVDDVPEPQPSAESADRAPVVSAILITGDRRLAVIDGRMVGPGDVLPGGERVESIEPQRLVLVDADGARRTLALHEEGT